MFLIYRRRVTIKLTATQHRAMSLVTHRLRREQWPLEDTQKGGTSADRVARWSKLVPEPGFIDFLSLEDGFKTCLSSGGAWANRDQPGIYFWLAVRVDDRVPSNNGVWLMAHDRPDSGPWPPSRLLTGTCSLIFEGQSFVPYDAACTEYWLRLPDEVREHMIELLAPLGWQHEIESFEAEFYGTLNWIGHGCGHLGVFGGIADVHEIVSVHFAPARSRNRKGSPRGIRGMLRRGLNIAGASGLVSSKE